MIQTKKNYVYSGFGLILSSEIRLPELTEMKSQMINPDISVVVHDLTNEWSEIDSDRTKFYVTNNQIMFEVPGTAIFLIQEGEKIVVSPISGAEEDKIRLYILGTCMGAALIQKGILPLHGSAIVINGKAYAFIGDSGAGKSTLAAAFIHAGYSLISDDVIPVRQAENGIPYVFPTYPQQKLWKESLNHFGMETGHYHSLFERETKYSVPISTHFTNEPLPLAGIFEILITDEEQVTIQKVNNLEQFSILYQHTFRNLFIPRLNLQSWHFKESSHILNHTKMFKLKRPAAGFTVNQMVEIILENILKEEKR